VSQTSKRLGISRQAYYKGHKSRKKRELQRGKLLEFVRNVRTQHTRMGGRKLLIKLSEEPEMYKELIGRDRFFNFLREEGLLIRPRKSRIKTTQSRHYLMKYPNLVKDVDPTGPNQVWVSDITYIKTLEGWLYLSLITDAYSRKIVGYELSDSLETIGCLKALKMALKNLPPDHSLIHHSDRGIQYCSMKYIGELKKHKVKVSMTEVDHCAENAMAERVNGILKDEYLYDVKYLTKKDVKSACHQTIYLYNTDRPHNSLKGQYPELVHAA